MDKNKDKLTIEDIRCFKRVVDGESLPGDAEQFAVIVRDKMVDVFPSAESPE